MRGSPTRTSSSPHRATSPARWSATSSPRCSSARPTSAATACRRSPTCSTNSRRRRERIAGGRRAAGAAQRAAHLGLRRNPRHPDRGDRAGRHPARGGRAQIRLSGRPARREHRAAPALPRQDDRGRAAARRPRAARPTSTAAADYLRIQKDGRLNVDLKYNHTDALTEADRGIVAAAAERPGRAVAAGPRPHRVPHADARGRHRLAQRGLQPRPRRRHLGDRQLARPTRRRQGENGLATVALTVPPAAFQPPTGRRCCATRPASAPLLAETKTSQVHVGGTLNGDGSAAGTGRSSATSTAPTRGRATTAASTRRAFQAAVTAGGDPLAPFGRAGPRAADTARSLAQSGSVDALRRGRRSSCRRATRPSRVKAARQRQRLRQRVRPRRRRRRRRTSSATSSAARSTSTCR